MIKLVGQLLEGTVTSLEVFFLTLIMALPLGFVVALGRMSKIKVVRIIVDTYIQIMRGTPLLLQLLFFLYFWRIPSPVRFSHPGLRPELRCILCRDLPLRAAGP